MEFEHQRSEIKPMKTLRHSFIGLQSPESLKAVSSMFRNAEHKANPEKYKTNLNNHVNYTSPDFDKVIRTEIQMRTYGSDELKLKVFKVSVNSKKKKRKSELGSVVSDVASAHEAAAIDDTLMQKHGLSAL